MSVRSAYDAAAASWLDGPERVYGPLAAALVSRAGIGDAVLDVGSGTGVAARAALAAGARQVLATDLSPAMARRCGVPAVVADATGLPFRTGAFDLALAACLLGHLPDIVAGLRELRRVARRVAASAFADDWSHPAKAAVDAALAETGYRPPVWYRRLKDVGEPAVGRPDRLAALARAAGFGTVAVDEIAVDTGVRGPAALVAWRLGMAHHAGFVRGLSAARRGAVVASAAAQLADAPPLVVPLLVLTAE